MVQSNNPKDQAALILSLLLRGLEQCRQRLRGQPGVTTPASLAEQWRMVLAQCVEVETIVQLVSVTTLADVTDGTVQSLTRLVFEAEQLAAGTVTTTPQPSPTTIKGLTPVFSQIELEIPRQIPPRRFQWQSLTATREAEPPIIPVAGDEVPLAEARQHLDALEVALQQLPASLDWTNWECVATHLLHILQVYGWCIPADPASTPCDISVYDQTRTASAIAACLLQAPSRAAERCLLLTGGLHGIQDYLYDIATIGAGGVAKRLRARSFVVQLLSEAASLVLLEKFKVPFANLLMCPGGQFTLLLPNVTDAPARLDTLQRAFEAWLLENFHGTLSLRWAVTPLTDEELAGGRFGAALWRVHDLLNSRQGQPFAGALQDADGQWRTDTFVGEAYGKDESDCKACHRFSARYRSGPEAEANDLCRQCHEQLELGRALTRAPVVSFMSPEHSVGLDCFRSLKAVVGRQPQAGARLVLRLNDPDVRSAARLPVAFRYYANHIKRRNDAERTPWSFEELAARCELNDGERGTGLLGILKADVDWLGALLQEGFRRDAPQTGFDTLTRLATFSRQLDWFFAGWLEWLMSNEIDIGYSVYSGGDDLLLIAPRGTVLTLAERIQRQFVAYVVHPDIHLSAGIAVVKPRLPLAHTVEQADQALQQAKDNGRDRLCVLGSELAWLSLPVVGAEIKELRGFEPPTALLYQFLRAARDWQRAEAGYVEAWRYHSRLAYQLARTVNPKEQRDLYQWTNRLLELPASASTRQLWRHLRLVTQWVLLERKER